MRPWEGRSEPADNGRVPRYDPTCRLCPGNERSDGVRNPPYRSTFVSDNDFPALLLHVAPPDDEDRDELFRTRPEAGCCRVFCLSPRHDLTMGQMELADVLSVVDMWVEQYRELGAMGDIRHVQIFENRGAMMGCSNPHPHGQIWANATVPDLVRCEDAHQAAYHARHGRTLLGDYVAREESYGERVVFSNGTFVALVPYWAAWPFETLIVPREPLADLAALSREQCRDFAAALREMNIRFDRLFGVPFPYTMGVHQRPTDAVAGVHWHLHVHYYPPLLRNAHVRKYMAGYEMLAMTQRDLTPEQAAAQLREHGASVAAPS